MSIEGGAQPFVKWVGGKRSLLPVILPLLPDNFENYFEPFAGGGALYFALAPGLKKATLVDRNLELVLAYQSIKKQPGALLARLKAHAEKHGKDYYYRVRKQKPSAPIEVAARFLYLNKTCFNGLYRVNKAGCFNAPMGSYRSPNIVPADNIRACHRTLQNTEILFGDFLKIEPLVKAGDFVYTTLLRKDYQFVENRQFEAGRLLDQPIFTVHYPIARSIYDTQLYCDFVLFHPTRHPDNLVIESKWQQSRGSVDEKFPFLIANIRERYPHATIIILDGGGYKKQAELWLRAQIDGKLLHVFNMQEFQKWSNGESL